MLIYALKAMNGSTMSKTNTSKTPASKTAAQPWETANPKQPGDHTHLTPAEKTAAKRRAKAAGRPYPNLVDNMQAAKAGKK
jgi:hypothetical protein